jgi:hypothetical protein
MVAQVAPGIRAQVRPEYAAGLREHVPFAHAVCPRFTRMGTGTASREFLGAKPLCLTAREAPQPVSSGRYSEPHL